MFYIFQAYVVWTLFLSTYTRAPSDEYQTQSAKVLTLLWKRAHQDDSNDTPQPICDFPLLSLKIFQSRFSDVFFTKFNKFMQICSNRTERLIYYKVVFQVDQLKMSACSETPIRATPRKFLVFWAVEPKAMLVGSHRTPGTIWVGRLCTWPPLGVTVRRSGPFWTPELTPTCRTNTSTSTTRQEKREFTLSM